MTAVSLPLEDDPRLQSQVLTWLIGRVERGPVEDLLQAGFPRELLEKLQSMTTAEVERLCMSRIPSIAVAFDPVRIMSSMQSVQAGRAMEDLLAYWVRNGATTAMLRLKFKISLADVTKLRKDLGVSSTQGGRPSVPGTESEIEAIVTAWLATSKASSDSRQRYKELHERFSGRYTLATLYSVIRQSEIDL